ncbi:hypothetical protein GKG47_09185 [Lactonifactor sp. BIOML-A3]|uniref:hypothetical protein n=1 Tax=unclassified Lactonifactor TaxID=2636670 RepID=UPI0012AEF0D8|nr:MULTISPECIES: hypothetical protein [unclassified Lactonifactor]MSA02210.1 hypothetical protein [Lactonifactor sp. BIOML-A5]MSA07995.1 hypothetical protein [Lactonifactor sp. BIOML-A4]MSA12611.1 hypothetical protein [Lactonifactor sp. BIOML-A3]MSA16688.1 hypothetical protein [Lactonifactor sp. BIOML-A2]MSA37613.1 hypothetical protein [Lactonifactor sp. BIOML-A1]
MDVRGQTLGILYKKYREDDDKLQYVITNSSKKVFVRLSADGTPETRSKNNKQLFEYSKAQNIVKHLPKTLKRFHFRAEAVPEVLLEPQKPTAIQNDHYIVNKDITRWKEKFGSCGDVFGEAKQREGQLLTELDIVDKEFLDILHIIEIEKPKDLYGGWKEYKRIQNNREKRRMIKDELLIIRNVIQNINPSCLERERIQKAIDGLMNRKYAFRILDCE